VFLYTYVACPVRDKCATVRVVLLDNPCCRNSRPAYQQLS
jgi:hypothetical protein